MRWRGNGCLLMAAFIWGTTFVAQSVGMEYRIIHAAMSWAPFVEEPTYEDYVRTNEETRRYAAIII